MDGTPQEQEPPTDRLVLVDPGVLAELPGQFGSPANALAFVADVRAMWPLRLARLEEALQTGSMAQAEEVATSIKVASQMAGAVMLGALAASLETLLSGMQHPQDHCEELQPLLAALRDCGQATMDELARYL